MQPFRCRLTLLVVLGFNTKLMTLNMPRRRPRIERGQRVKDAITNLQNRLQSWMTGNFVFERQKPTFDAAIQRVVILTLIMRLMRLHHDAIARHCKRTKPSPPITSTIGHVSIHAKIIPTRSEGVPVLNCGARQQRAKFSRSRPSKATVAKRFGNCGCSGANGVETTNMFFSHCSAVIVAREGSAL